MWLLNLMLKTKLWSLQCRIFNTLITNLLDFGLRKWKILHENI